MKFKFKRMVNHTQFILEKEVAAESNIESPFIDEKESLKLNVTLIKQKLDLRIRPCFLPELD
jgi:hypothetical protein